ncbi:antitermination protein Q [Caballeronia sp. KNU42]
MSRDSLGALLESLKWGNRHQDYGQSVKLLSERVQQRTRRGVYLPLVHAAIHEWLDDSCRRCTGSGLQLDKRTTSVLGRPSYATCAKCNGTGVHNHTDYERASLAKLQAGAWKKHESDYEGILQCLRGAVAAHRVGAMAAFGEREGIFA